MGFNLIKVACRSCVTTITLDRPEALNAINEAMHHELQAAFDAFAADPEQLVCVVTGSGDKAFCAGSDLKDAERPITYPRCGYAGLAARFDLNKPVIAAVNGYALGGGFELALACDLIVAADHASFALPEPLVGAMAFAGGIHRLVRQIGLKQAMAMLLAVERVSAARGRELGFVNEVVPAQALDEAVDRWCRNILAAAPLAVRATKETAMRGLDEPGLAAALANQADYPGFRAWAASEDLIEGPRAFVEKRQPVWRGR